MAELEAAAAEEERLLDFDKLCSTVAKQTRNGKWGRLNEEENGGCEYGGGVHRMWEGELVNDCFDDRRIALQSLCCPCYRFGKNMTRAGFGSCFLQGSIHLILVVVTFSSLVAFILTRRCYFLYLAISSAFSFGTYMGYYRIQMKKKFNIKGGETSFDDCVNHLICPCCTLCQESRTLEMNNVQDGIWHGRGDTICIRSFPEASKAYLELEPAFVVSTKGPDVLSMQKGSSDGILV